MTKKMPKADVEKRFNEITAAARVQTQNRPDRLIIIRHALSTINYSTKMSRGPDGKTYSIDANILTEQLALIYMASRRGLIDQIEAEYAEQYERLNPPAPDNLVETIDDGLDD